MRGVDLRERLAGELERRRTRNPRYSLRAFARQLRFDHAALSQFLRRRRRLGTASLRALAARAGLAPEAIAACCAAEVDDAVLAAVGRVDFRADSRWLAVRTNLATDEVNVALQRLLHRGALRMASKDSWIVEGSK